MNDVTMFHNTEWLHKFASSNGAKVFPVGDLRSVLVAINYARLKGPIVLDASVEVPILAAAERRMIERVIMGAGCLSVHADFSAAFSPRVGVSAALIIDPSMNLADVNNQIRDVRPYNRNEGPGIGNWRVGEVVLLIGDRPSTKWPSSLPNWPFISTLNTGCSKWLADQLQDADVPENALYWVNAYNQHGDPTDPAFIERLKPIGIVTLGGEAKKWATSEAGVAHNNVHHPQYWKRHQSGKRYILAETIQGLRKAFIDKMEMEAEPLH